jgi:hypothetical protein
MIVEIGVAGNGQPAMGYDMTGGSFLHSFQSLNPLL